MCDKNEDCKYDNDANNANANNTNNTNNEIETYDNFYKIKCPHCNISIIIMKNEVNCKIFRCGQYKTTGEPIPPHSSKELCDKLRNAELIYGCANPFMFDGKQITICDYI